MRRKHVICTTSTRPSTRQWKLWAPTLRAQTSWKLNLERRNTSASQLECRQSWRNYAKQIRRWPPKEGPLNKSWRTLYSAVTETKTAKAEKKTYWDKKPKIRSLATKKAIWQIKKLMQSRKNAGRSFCTHTSVCTMCAAVYMSLSLSRLKYKQIHPISHSGLQQEKTLSIPSMESIYTA